MLHGGEQVCVSVHDTGIGIPDDKLEDIFTAFQQVRCPWCLSRHPLLGSGTHPWACRVWEGQGLHSGWLQAQPLGVI